MKAAIVEKVGGDFVVQDVDLSDPIGTEVRIQVKASGLCHSDLTLKNNDLGFPVPGVFGHEPAGIVTAVGPDVTGFEVGDHVVGTLIQACGECAACLAGKSYNCLHPERTLRDPGKPARITRGGESVFQVYGLGGFAQEALVDQRQLAKIPDELPWAQASLLGCGVLTGAGAVLNKANVQTGETVVIMGAGGVGLNAVSGAVLAGASRIIVTDIDDGKLERAKKFGATDLINSAKVDPVEAVQDLTGGGADYVFDFVGAPPVALQGVNMLGMGGGLYMVGLTGDVEATLPLPMWPFLNARKRIDTVNMGQSNLKRDIPMYADFYLQGRFNLDDLVTNTISLSEIDAGYELLKDGATARVVITDFDR